MQTGKSGERNRQSQSVLQDSTRRVAGSSSRSKSKGMLSDHKLDIASGDVSSLDEQRKAEIERAFDEEFANEELDAAERRRELAKLFKMEKHERAGHCLEFKMLRHLNRGDPQQRRLEYKAGQTIKDLIRSQDPSSKKTFDEFFVDHAIRDHLDQLLCPLTERVNELTKTVGSLRSQAQVDEEKISQNAQKIDKM